MANIIIKVVKKKLLCIIKSNKKREKGSYRSVDLGQRRKYKEENTKKKMQRSLVRYYKLKAQYKE